MLRLWMVALLLLAGITAGCGDDDKNISFNSSKEIVLYSELDNKFTEDLLQEFNKEHKGKVTARAIYEIKQGEADPDVVLAEQRTLNGLWRQGRLQAVPVAAGKSLPAKLRHKDNLWYGIFYDPAVLLVNQQFARTVGQSRLHSWQDLEYIETQRIAMENLSDSNSTQNFLGAFADAKGETTSLNYLWNINRFVEKYAKFPFTPVRITAVGDADVAITRQRYVLKYLESKFPAYVVFPKEGTPVNLYGTGVFKNCNKVEYASDLVEWLLTDEKVQAVSQADATGYMFFFPSGGEAPDMDKLWLNQSYLTQREQEALTNRWLGRVRFSK